MKLEAVQNGRLYASDYRDVYVHSEDGTLSPVGTLPALGSGVERPWFHLRTSRGLKRPVETLTGAFPTVNVFSLDSSALVATTNRWLLSSADGGATWSVTGRLPRSSGPMGVLPSAFCVHDGDAYLGEYPLSDEHVARIRRSTDDGSSWETHLELPDVRHFHAVQSDPYSDTLWATTGDRDEECYIGRLEGSEFVPVGGGSQEWRAVELAFTPDAILWGVDCGYAEENRLYRLDRAQLSTADPTPTAVATLDASVYYTASLTVDGDRWVAFSTVAGSGTDSTAPSASMNRTTTTRVIAGSSASNYTRWYELTSSARRRGVGERLGLDVVPSANAYTFLDTDGERLFVNPFNTVSDHGTVVAYGPEAFDRLDSDSEIPEVV